MEEMKIYIESITFYPRSKVYDVIWKIDYNGEKKLEQISEELLVWFIKESGANKTTYYINLNMINPLMVLERDEEKIIRTYLEHYRLKP